VKGFSDQINELNDILKYESKLENENQSIKKSFASDNDNLVKYSANSKVVLTVNFDSREKSEALKSINISEPINSEINKNELERFKLLLYRLLGLNQEQKASLDYKLKSINFFKLKEQELIACKLISDEEVLIKYNTRIRLSSNFLKIVNIKTGLVISDINRDNQEMIACWIKHLNQILVVFIDLNESALFDKSGNLAKMIELNIQIGLCYSSRLYYNMLTRKTFLLTKNIKSIYLYEYDENFNCKKFETKSETISYNM
jgi:hypothetical protein